MINKEIILNSIDVEINVDMEFKTLGLSNSKNINTLTFLDDLKYLDEVVTSDFITGVITTIELGEKVEKLNCKIHVLKSSDPRYDFFTLQNYISLLNFEINKFESQISETAKIHHTAWVSNYNVKIGNDVVIQPNVTIMSDVEIGDNVIIHAGTVIGCEGFEHKRTSQGVLSVIHDGKVLIGDRVEIGANCAISKGFSYRNTSIGVDTKLDNLVHVAHGVQIGQRCFLPACCMIAGSTSIGDDCWIGPNASISSQIKVGKNSFVTIGSVVVRNVKDFQRVTGNFAVPHIQFLKSFNKIFRGS